MTITLYSSTLNHYQLPFCLEMEKLLGRGNFIFVSSLPLSKERIALGFPDINDQYSFVLKSFESELNRDRAYELALDSDVAIFGVAPEKLIRDRMKQNKITFRYKERLFKKTRLDIFKPWVLRAIVLNHTRYAKKRLYMLCASAYTAGDYQLGGAYKNKCFRWGYFSELNILDINKTLNEKRNKCLRLLWVGRFLKWKHPENAILVAEYLMNKGYDFILDMLGIGPEMEKIKRLIAEKKLEHGVNLRGGTEVNSVREYMRLSNIFIFTSGQGEGWGVVLNEAMNSGCAVVANSRIGSVPYLIKDGINGYMYNNSVGELCKKVEELFCNEKLRNEFSMNAYKTILEEWNPGNAAKRLLLLIEDFNSGNNGDIFPEGILSIDKVKL